MCECYECGKEIGNKEGYISDGVRICDKCAYELTVQEKPSAYYFDEENEIFDKMALAHTQVVADDWKSTRLIADNDNYVYNPDLSFDHLIVDEDPFAQPSLEDSRERYQDANEIVVESLEAFSEYDTYYTNKALCVACGEVNYAEPVCEVEGLKRMVCCDCIEIVNCCQECNNLTLDYVYESTNDGISRDLCFDCKFKTKEKEQMPLAVHLAIRSDIQFLTDKQFDILADYAELAQLTIFEAYRYKSRCHFYDCDRMIEPSKWNAEEAVQFCCKRHDDLADIVGCHCQNVYEGSNYDDEYEEATCKMCNNSNYDTNMIPRIALKNSDLGDKPIVSAICVFEEGIKMSNVLAESLVDLCEYFN